MSGHCPLSLAVKLRDGQNTLNLSHPMRRLPALTLTLLLVCIPIASAQPLSYASELFALLRSQQQPLDFALTEQVYLDSTYAAAWVSGSTQGSLNAGLSSLRATAKATVDVAWPGGKARVKLQVRLVDSTLYVLIEKIEGSYNDSLTDIAGHLQLKKWVAFPLEDSFGDTASLADAYAPILDSFFTVNPITTRTGTTHEVTLTRETLRSLLQQMRQLHLTQADTEKAVKLSPPTLSFLLKVDTDSNSSVTGTRVTASAKLPDFGLTVESHTTRRPSPVVVTAPTNIMSLDEASQDISIPSSLPFLPDGLPSMDSFFPGTDSGEETIDDSDWEEPTDVWEDTETESGDTLEEGSSSSGLPFCAPDAGAGAVRRGVCVFPR